MDGEGVGQVIVDDVNICDIANRMCEIRHKGSKVVLKAVYDASKYRFEGFHGVNCLSAEQHDEDVCNFVLENNDTVVIATFGIR
jgi:hypothetical protein